jgi:hypothetical protein
MKKKIFQKITAFILFVAIMSGCSSTTLIQSIPSGAKIYVDGEPVGKTPYKITDTKITGASTSIKLELDDHEPLLTYLTKDEEVNVGAIVGGVFFVIPFLWTMQYKPVHTYELQKINIQDSVQGPLKSSTIEKIRELKKLYDEGIITTDEFENAKKRILSE